MWTSKMLTPTCDCSKKIAYIVGLIAARTGRAKIDQIEYEYIAKYGEIERKTLQERLGELTRDRVISRCKRGV